MDNSLFFPKKQVEQTVKTIVKFGFSPAEPYQLGVDSFDDAASAVYERTYHAVISL